MTYLNETTNKWVGILVTVIPGIDPPSVYAGTGGGGGTTPSTLQGVTSTTPHFTSFSVLLGNDYTNEDDGTVDNGSSEGGGDGDTARILAIVLPSVLVPIGLGVILLGILTAAGVLVYGRYKRKSIVSKLMGKHLAAEDDNECAM